MNAAKRGLTAAERALWRRVVAAVEPSRSRATVPEPDPDPVVLPAAPDGASQRVHLGPPARRSAPAPSAVADRGAERRVRRGQIDVEAVLDLHGRTLETAHAALLRFLHDAHARHQRCVLVITGKGSRGEGAIRRSLPLWLETPELRALVSGRAQAHRSHGGEGALYLFLRRQ